MRKCARRFFPSYLKETKKSTVNSYNLISYHLRTKSKEKKNSHKIKQNSNWTESARINLSTAMAEWLFSFELPSFRNAQIKAVQTVSISLLSATFSCVLRLWFKRFCCDVVYNDVTRDSIACSLTLRHVTENRYVKYPVHNSCRYESSVLTNRIAGKRMNI